MRILGRTAVLSCLLLAGLSVACSDAGSTRALTGPRSADAKTARFANGASFRLKVTITTARVGRDGKAHSQQSAKYEFRGVFQKGRGGARPFRQLASAGEAAMRLVADSAMETGGDPLLFFVDDATVPFMAAEGSSSWTDEAGSWEVVTHGSPSNPSGSAEVYRNGAIHAALSETWTQVAGGWRLTSQVTTVFEHGQVAAVGTIVPSGGGGEGDEEPVWEMSAPHAVSSPVIKLAARCQEALGRLLLPSVAYAAEDCHYYTRKTGLFLAGMVVSTITSNPFGFFLSAAGIAKGMHDYAACRERERRWAQ